MSAREFFHIKGILVIIICGLWQNWWPCGGDFKKRRKNKKFSSMRAIFPVINLINHFGEAACLTRNTIYYSIYWSS